MSTHPPTLNPSQAVERIREIIVGRHLERLEQRVARLETPGAANTVPLDDRLLAHEAHIEALRQNIQRLAESTREDAELRAFYHREETQRLAAQIQQVAAAKSAEATRPANPQLEQKLGRWLGDWQQAVQRQLDEREEKVTARLRAELISLWEGTEAHITRVESRISDRGNIEERFRRIAHAARLLAECAAPPSASAEHKSPR
jgi:DNA repair exonuclease SbcCD ATPase subunit